MESEMVETSKQNDNSLLEYEIVRLRYRFNLWQKRWVLEKDYLLVVDDYVNRGWDLLQLFQSNTRNFYGSPEYLELVFKRPLQEYNPKNRRVKFR